eukprot:1137898-Pelagomonas_calceolata.AAC.1
MANKKLEQASTALTDSKNSVNPNGAGITNTICRAELAAIAAAITHSYLHIASDSLTSLHQRCKQLTYPEKHRQHIQGDVRKAISTLISNSQTNICIYNLLEIKSHTGLPGNECADANAKYQANQLGWLEANISVADTGIPGAGPGGYQFSCLFWLAKVERREPTTGTSTAPAPSPKITYLPNLHDALKSHVYHLYDTKHRF